MRGRALGHRRCTPLRFPNAAGSVSTLLHILLTAPRLVWDIVRIGNISLAHAVVPHEISQVKSLAVRQCLKLDAALPQCDGTKGELARHWGIPNGLKRYFIKTKTAVCQQYAQLG